MKRGLTVVLAALVLLTGCDGGYGYGEDRFVYNLVSMEIADAQSLYLGLPEEKDGVTARDMDGYVLFKITKDGIIAKVKFHYEKEAVGDSENGNTENGNTENEDIDILQPQTVWNANEEYFIVTFRNRDTYTDIPYLVSKTTGTVYSLENVGVPYDCPSMYVNSSPVLSDGKNNIYFVVWPYSGNSGKFYELFRIDVTNPEKVFAKPLTAPNDKAVTSFAVDAVGNVVYCDHLNNADVNRLAFADGGYADLNHIVGCFTAPDGKFYYAGYSSPLTRLDIEGKKVNETPIEIDNNESVPISSFESYYLTMGDRSYVLSGDNSFGCTLGEVYNPEGKPRQIKGIPPLTNIQAVAQSEEELFIAGKNDKKSCVIRVNPVTGAWSDLYTPGDYEVYNMVYAGGRLTVNALRMNDGAIIMGELDGTGKMNVLDETSNSKVLYLTRIK